jgi:uncharacterized RDD family membrane protein YckC
MSSASARPHLRPQVDHDEVLTGEAVVLDVQPIGLLLRAAGAAIDIVASFLLLLACYLLLGALGRAGLVDEVTARIAPIAMMVVIFVILPASIETLTRGRSLGKLAVGGRIVRNDGGAIGFRHAFIRALLGVLEVYMTLGSIALIVGIFTPRAQRLGDLVAGTYAERTRTPSLPPDARRLPPGMEGWAAIADVARVPDRLGRRLTQFAAGAAKMVPVSRARIAAELADEVSPFVAPIPPVDAETLIHAVVAVRRERELRALTLQAERVASLTR